MLKGRSNVQYLRKFQCAITEACKNHTSDRPYVIPMILLSEHSDNKQLPFQSVIWKKRRKNKILQHELYRLKFNTISSSFWTGVLGSTNHLG